jgi:hypothetical protein
MLKVFCLVLALAAASALLHGCNNHKSESSTSPTTNVSQPTPESSPMSAFERDLQFIRKGQFNYIWVFARRDGKALDKDDGAYLRTKAPQVIDWVTTDEGKKVIAGTNFNLEEGNLELLKKRFVVEDYTGK